MKNALLSILGGIVLIGLCIGGWQLHWYLAKSSVSHNYEINTGTQQYQNSLIAAERDRVQAYDTSDSDGQKIQIASTFCAVYPTINPPAIDLASAYTRLCNQG